MEKMIQHLKPKKKPFTKEFFKALLGSFEGKCGEGFEKNKGLSEKI